MILTFMEDCGITRAYSWGNMDVQILGEMSEVKHYKEGSAQVWRPYWGSNLKVINAQALLFEGFNFTLSAACRALLGDNYDFKHTFNACDDAIDLADFLRVYDERKLDSSKFLYILANYYNKCNREKYNLDLQDFSKDIPKMKLKILKEYIRLNAGIDNGIRKLDKLYEVKTI